MPYETNFAEERAALAKRIVKLGGKPEDVDTVIGKNGITLRNVDTVRDLALRRALGLSPVALVPSGGAEAVHANNPVEKLAAHFRANAEAKDRNAEIVAEMALKAEGRELSAVEKLQLHRAQEGTPTYRNPKVRPGQLRPDLESDFKRLTRMSAKFTTIAQTHPIMAGQMEPEINRLRARLKSAGVDLSAIGG